MNQTAISLEAFNIRTKFAVMPDRIYLNGANYPGCIHVHLSNYNDRTFLAWPGGDGLAVTGRFTFAGQASAMLGAHAVVSGFHEVMAVAAMFEDIVVLRPLGIGLGCLGKRNFALSRMNIERLTGELPQQAERMYYLAMREGECIRHIPVTACTLDQVRCQAMRFVDKHISHGWECGGPTNRHAVQWLCQKDGRNKWIEVQYGTPRINNANLG